MKEHSPDGRAIDDIIHVLLLRDISVKDFTKHLCKIECNEALKILIEDKCLQITKNLDKVSKLHEGESLQLEVRAIGVPIPVYQWYKNNHEIPSEKRNVLLLKNVGCVDCFRGLRLNFDKIINKYIALERVSDEGEYFCTVAQPKFKEFSKKVLIRVCPRSPTNHVEMQDNFRRMTIVEDLPNEIREPSGGIKSVHILVEGEGDFEFSWFINNTVIGNGK